MQVYAVALWESEHLQPEQVARVEAPDAFTAVLLVMHGAGLRCAKRAVVSSGDGIIHRWFDVGCMLAEEETEVCEPDRKRGGVYGSTVCAR